MGAIDALGDDVVTRRSAEARAALEALLTALDGCIDDLHAARRQAIDLRSRHEVGDSWATIVSAEPRPLIVERISTTLAALSASGSRWRRAQALALQAEGVSINRIAAMFGVTRQRISTLVRESPSPEPDQL